MSEPEEYFSKWFFRFYSKIILFEGLFVNPKAYNFLVKSISNFDKKRLILLLRENGFKNIKLKSQLSNAAFIVTASKQ
jgi:ubiquinone/menaquinone biosynthesis C-methylase UbiE